MIQKENFSWDKFLQPYELAVEGFILKMEGIKKQYKLNGISCPIEIISGRIKTPDSITLLEDLIFISISGSLIIYGIIIINNGEIRLFLFLAIFLGMLIYFLTISNLYVIIFYEIVNLCKKILKIPFLCLNKIQKYAINLIKKDF